MKPRTKIEKEVDRMIPWLPKLDVRKERQMALKVFDGDFHGYFNGKRIACMCCGNTFSIVPDFKNSVCPVCGEKLNIEKSRKYTQKMGAYICQSSQFNENWQVFRYFLFRIECRMGEPFRVISSECWQKWLSSEGKVVVAAKPRGLAFYYDHWLNAPITIKHPYTNAYGNNYAEWEGAHTEMESIIPNIIRNGYNGYNVGLSEWQLFKALLSQPFIETLYKAKQYGLVKYLVSNKVADYKIGALKIALRKHYQIEDLNMWFDTIGMLNEMGKDIRNPHYICPENLRKTHNELVDAVNRKRHREWAEAQKRREEQKLLEMEKDKTEYIEKHKKFFDLDITNGVLHIKPLKSVEEFREEGGEMHHCVFTNRYYKKADTLILSAKINGKRIETVEVSLNNFEVVQCYGACNKLTPYHDAIVNLVTENMEAIRELSYAKLRMAV